MVVVGLVGVVMVAVPGLPACAVHVPVPVAAIVAEPPGTVIQLTVLSGPALGRVDIVTRAVSVHEPLVQINLYVPNALNVVMVVVGLVGVVMVAVPGLPAWADHVPVPVPPIVTEPPGSVTQLRDLSGPALGLEETTTVVIPLQPDTVHTKV